MKPTTLKTQTTKRLSEMAHDEQGLIDIGGIEHAVHCWEDLVYLVEMYDLQEYRCCLSREVHPTAQVTVTDERPMEVRDLQVGDCFVPREDVDNGALCVCIDDSDTGFVKALRVHNRRVRHVSISFRGAEVTLVTPTFDAEPVEDERTVPVHEAGKFVLAGAKGVRVGAVEKDWVWVEWKDEPPLTTNRKIYPLPVDTPVTVHESAKFDSWDDVSVGDVAIDRNLDQPAIYLGDSEWLLCDGQRFAAPADPCGFTPAHLTHVDYTLREEVSR